MSRRRRRWFDLLAPVGQAGLDLLRAEYGVVSSEIKVSARVLVKSLLLLLTGLFALFWAIGALALLLLEVGALWLPRWAAAASVLGVFVLVGLTLAAIARKRLRTVDAPNRMVRRRLDEHRDWWEERIVGFSPSGRARARPRSPSSDPTAAEEPGPAEPAEPHDDQLA